MKTTKYFETMMARPDRSIIKRQWIQQTINQPIKEEIQADGRIRRWAAR